MTPIGARWRRRTPGLEPEWVVPLPRRLTAPPPGAPQGLIHRELVVIWGGGLVLAVAAATGALVYKRRLGPWRACGFDEGGRLALVHGPARGRLDPATGAIEQDPAATPAPRRETRDAPERPEEDPTLLVGSRLYRVRTQTNARVTRHWVEVVDPGLPPRTLEVAAFTLRSDRLALVDQGGLRVYGSVGSEIDCPVGALVGGATGPVLVLRRRHPVWHEHAIPEGEPDLVGHGPAHLGAAIIPEGGGPPRSRELGVVVEHWEGLGVRGAPRPPRLTRALGARPLGLADGRIIIELTDAARGRISSTGRLAPRRRLLVGFCAADLC